MYFAIVLIVLVVGGLIYWSMNRDSATTKTTVKTSDGVDTIIISNSGSTRESFIDSPYRRCVSFDPNRPAPGWCSNLDGTDPMSYWYDVDNYDNTVPRFNVIDETTGECVNPNDCKKFTENLDSSNKLIDIKAADGTDFIETIANDVYSGKLVLPDNIISSVDFDFDTGVMSGKDSEGNIGTVIKPGENFAIGFYVAILFTLYKKAGKPKPNIKFDFTSGDSNTILTAMRRLG